MKDLSQLKEGTSFYFENDPVTIYRVYSREMSYGDITGIIVLKDPMGKDEELIKFPPRTQSDFMIYGEVTPEIAKEFIDAFEEFERGQTKRDGYDTYNHWLAAESSRLLNYQKRSRNMLARYGLTMIDMLDYLNK